MVETRVCRTCSIESPLDADHFHRCSNNASGYRKDCKWCHTTAVRACQLRRGRKQAASKQAAPEVAAPVLRAVDLEATPAVRRPPQRPFEVELIAPFWAQHRFPCLADLMMPTDRDYAKAAA